jgi:hypothetical protein
VGSGILVTEFKAELTVDARRALAEIKEKNAAQRQDGGKILVLVVSRADFRRDDSLEGFNRTVTEYEVLLQDTYGAENVTLHGAGYETFPEEETDDAKKRAYKESLNFSEYKFLTQYEFTKLIRSFSGEKYDQIHIVGHGDPDLGLLFFGGRNLFGEINPAVGFEMARAERAGLNEPKNWPLNPGCKIVLMGCGSAAGDFGSFLTNPDYGIAGAGDVFTMFGDFQCEGKDVTFGPPEIPPEERPVIGRITLGWYHAKQYGCIRDLGLWLRIQEARRR